MQSPHYSPRPPDLPDAEEVEEMEEMEEIATAPLQLAKSVSEALTPDNVLRLPT